MQPGRESSRPFVIPLPNCGSRGIETRAFLLGQTVSCLGTRCWRSPARALWTGAFRRGAALMASYHHRETSPLADPIVLSAAPLLAGARSLSLLHIRRAPRFYCARPAVRGFFRGPTSLKIAMARFSFGSAIFGRTRARTRFTQYSNPARSLILMQIVTSARRCTNWRTLGIRTSARLSASCIASVASALP